MSRLRHKRKANSHLTPKEAEVLDLWDGGFSTIQIAGQTGRPHKEVRKLVMMYHAGGDGGDAHRAIRSGSASLLAALRREGMVA